MSDETQETQSSIGEEQNYSLKEEIVHLDQLFLDSHQECDDVASHYRELAEQVDRITNQQLEEEPNEDDDTVFCVEQQKEFETELAKYKSRISAYKNTQQEQSKIIDDLSGRIEEYRNKCAKLEAVLGESMLQSDVSKDVLDYTLDQENSLSIETLQLKLEQEQNRCERLEKLNTHYQSKLDAAVKVNNSMNIDTSKLLEEYKRTRRELEEKEESWKKDERALFVYMKNEHHRLVKLWHQIHNFQSKFSHLKSATKNDLFAIKGQLQSTSVLVTDACHRLSIVTSDIQSECHQEIVKLRLSCDAEKISFNQRIQDLQFSLDKQQLLLDEKDRHIDNLKQTVHAMESSLSLQGGEIEDKSGSLFSENLLCKTLKDIGEIISDDADRNTWGNTYNSNLAVVRDIVVSCTPYSLSKAVNNMKYLESLVDALQYVLNTRCHQVEELQHKITASLETIQSQEKFIESLEKDKGSQNLMIINLTSQLDTANRSINDLTKESQKMQSKLQESESQKSILDKKCASLENQIESIGMKNNQLLREQNELREAIEQLQAEKKELFMSEQKLKGELRRGNEKVHMIEKELLEVERLHQETEREMKKMSVDKELLQQQNEEFSSKVKQLEKQRSDLNAKVLQLQKDGESLKHSVKTLQDLNNSLNEEKDDLNKSLTDLSVEAETAKMALKKDKLTADKERQELKEKYEISQERCTELEVEIKSLKENLASLEEREKELDVAQSIIVKRNLGLIKEVNVLSSQKSVLQKELEQCKQEIASRLESKEKLAKERENFAREKGELTLRSSIAETELAHMKETVAILREERDKLAKELYESQQLSTSLLEEKQDEKKEDNDKSHVVMLQDQLRELRRLREIECESAARQKNASNQKLEQLDRDYKLLLKNIEQQHQSNMDALIREKEAQRIRLESARDDLVKQLEAQIDGLLNKHSEEISSMNKQMILQKKEVEDRLFNTEAEHSRQEKKLKQEIESLKKVVKELKGKLSDMELQRSNAEKKLSFSVDHSKHISEDVEKDKLKMKEEMRNMSEIFATKVNKLEEQIEDMKRERDDAFAQVIDLKQQLTVHSKEISVGNSYIVNTEDDNIQDDLKQDISVLQQMLSNEKKKVELTNKTLEDVKQRLMKVEADKSQLKQSLQHAQQQVSNLEKTGVIHAEEYNDMRETLRELEASRIEIRRESHNLRKRLVISEAANESKDQEISEMQILLSRAAETENELKKDIRNLKQKTLEAEASKEAKSKELSNLRRKYQDLEQKLKYQHEEYNASLKENLSGEKSHAEQRFMYEKALVESSEEAQNLRLELNYAEGKISALEVHISKLEAAKHELEHKLQSLHYFLRSSLGLTAPDSGFQGSSSQLLLLSPFSFRGDSPQKMMESFGVSTQESHSPNERQPSTSALPQHSHEAPLSALDLNFDLIKSALRDLVQKFYSSEKEKNDLQSSFKNLEIELDSVREEHCSNMKRFQELQREVEITVKDKKELENQLVTCKSAIAYLEQRVEMYEKEKKILSEKNSNLMQAVTSAENDKSNFQVKIAELRGSESRLKKENLLLTESLQASNLRATKVERLSHDVRAEARQMEESLLKKISEVEKLQQTVTELKKMLSESEVKNSSLQFSVERLNTQIGKYQDSETILQEKLRSLENSYAEANMSSHQLSKEVMHLKKEHAICEQEKSSLRNEIIRLKNMISDLRSENESMKREIRVLEEAKKQYDLEKATLEGQLMGVMSYNEESEKDAKEKLRELEKEKLLLEDQLSMMKNGIDKTDHLRLRAEKQKSKYEKENTLLKKALDKVEKERQKTEEIASRSVLERSALGKSLSKMEIENQHLIQKVQNLQVQLVESEQRHLERLRDLDKRQKFEMQLELERLRGTEKHMEQLLADKDKSYRLKISSLEQQVSTLQEQVRQNQSSFYRFQPSRSASVGILSTPKQQPPDSPPVKQSQELARAHDTTFGSLPSTDDNLLSHSFPSSQRLTSTPQARRKIERSFPL